MTQFRSFLWLSSVLILSVGRGKAVTLPSLTEDIVGVSCKCFFFFFSLYLFIFYFFDCVGSSLLCKGFLQLRQAGVTLHRGAWASHCRGLSCWEHRLQTRRLSSCGSRAQLLRSMWDLPRPGLEPASPALAGGFSTTAPPGKPCKCFLKALEKDRVQANTK